MSSSDRRAVLIGLMGAAFAQAGCLRPMLAKGTPASDLRGRIALPAVDGRFGYFLDQSLAEGLGRPAGPDLRLDVTTEITERGIAIAQDNSATRITLLATAHWAVWRAGDAEPLLSDRTSVQAGYNATSSLYATRQTRLDIERRLARDLGERIARSILARADQLGT